MPKCYHPRLIDLPQPKKAGNGESFSLSVQEEDGAPDVANVQRLRFPNGALINHGGGDVSVAGGSGGGTPHQVHFSLMLPATVIPPGPTNITGGTLTITAIQFSSDGEISGSCSPGGSFSFSAGGGSDRTNDLSIDWVDGTTMSVAITNQGADGTWLAIDIVAE